MNMQASIAANDAEPAAASIIIAERAALLSALAFLNKSIVEKRNTIPILSGVLFRPIGEGDDVPFTIQGTDLDLQATVEISGCWSTPLPFVAASCAALHDAVKACPGDTVTLEIDGGKLTVSGGGASMKLSTLPADDFPLIAFAEPVATFRLEGRDLAADLARVSHAISTEETRYYLNGIFMHRYQDAEDAAPVLRMAATDGHRMVVQTRAAPEGSDALPGVIIPRKTAAAMMKLIGKPIPAPKSVAAAVRAGRTGKFNPDAEFSVTESKVSIRLGRTHIVSKLIDGTFPDYVRVIPTANDKRLTLSADALATATKTAAAVLSERTRSVKLTLVDREAVEFLCVSAENGVGKASAECDWIADEGAFEIGFNASYLEDMADCFAGLNVTLHLADAAAPTLFTSPDAPGFRAVLMPMRVCDEPRDAEPDAEPSEAALRPYDVFERDYGAAFAARDGAAMRAAVEAYKPASVHAYGPETARIARLAVARDAETIRYRAGCTPKRVRHYTLQQQACEVERQGFVATGQRGARSPSSFACLGEYERRVTQLATLAGYDPADPRKVLPVMLADRETVKLILAESLRDMSVDYLCEVSPTGKPVNRRRGSSSVARNRIIGVVMPKLKADEAAAMMFGLQRENLMLRELLGRLELRIVALEARPVSISVPAEAVEKIDMPEPAPAPEPSPLAIDSIAVASAPEPDPVPAAPVDPEPVAAALGDFASAFTPPVIAGFATAPDQSGRLAELEAELAAVRAERDDYQAAAIRLGANAESLGAVKAQLEADLADALRKASDNLDLAQANAERAVAATEKLRAAEAELERLAPLASVIASMAAAPAGLNGSPVPALVDARGRELTTQG